MNATEIEYIRTPEPAHEEEANYLNAGITLKSWLLTTDHKRIGLLYLFAIIFFFFIAAVAAIYD